MNFILQVNRAQVSVIADDGRTPLMYAEILPIAQSLVRARANLNARCFEGKTALDRARARDEKQIMGYLEFCEAKANSAGVNVSCCFFQVLC